MKFMYIFLALFVNVCALKAHVPFALRLARRGYADKDWHVPDDAPARGPVSDVGADALAPEPMAMHSSALSDGIDVEAYDVEETFAASAPTSRARPLTYGAGVLQPRPYFTATAIDDKRRKGIAKVVLIIGLLAIACVGVRRGDVDVQVADGNTRPFCRAQVIASVLAVITAVVSRHSEAAPLPAIALFLNAAAHTALLLRGMFALVETRHTFVSQQYHRRLVAWSVWLDLRAHLSAVAAVFAGVTLSFCLVLSVLVTVGGDALWPWAWWGSHAFLSLATLTIFLMNRSMHKSPSTPSTIFLVCNVIAGIAHAAGGVGGRRLDYVTPALLLAEGVCSWFLSLQKKGYTVAELEAIDAPFRDTLAGRTDLQGFKNHLVAENRVCVLYCYQDIELCEKSESPEEMREQYNAWRAQFVIDAAPFRVPDSVLAAVQLERADGTAALCPQAMAHRAREALMDELRAPFARFLARKNRLTCSEKFSYHTTCLPFPQNNKLDDVSAIV